MTGIIFDIKKYAIHDGPGIRTTVFLKGCPLACWWCHNPEGRGAQVQQVEKTTKLDGRDVAYTEEIGRKVTVAEVIREVEKDISFYDESGGGVTFSGGEVFMQTDFLTALLKECNKREIHTCVDTTGFTKPELLEQVMPFTDLFLFDVKLMDDEEHKRYAGVSNVQILENLKRIVTAGKAVRLRFPIIPGITDTEHNLEAVAELANHLGNPPMDILPYHRIGSDKYRRLNMAYSMGDTEPPTPERVQEIAEFFASYGLHIKVGG